MAQGSVFRGRWFKVYHFLGARMFHYSFFIWVFFHEHSRFTVQKEKGEAISLIALYHFHPFQTLRHLNPFKDTQTFRQRHCCRELPSLHTWQPDLNWEHLVSRRKSIATTLRALYGKLNWGQKYRVFFRENTHSEAVAYMLDLVFSSVCFITIKVIQIIFWRFHKRKKKPPVEVTKKDVLFCWTMLVFSWIFLFKCQCSVEGL